LAEHIEAHNQLKQQLAEDLSQREELNRQLQGRQLELDQDRIIIADHQQAQQAQQSRIAELEAQLNGAKAEIQDERHISTQLQAELDRARLEAQTEHNTTAQTQRTLETVSAELRAEQQQKDELQLQLNHLRDQFQAEQQHSIEVSEQLSRARVEFEAEQKLSSEYQIQLGNARSEVHTQQQFSTQLQAQLQKVRPQLSQSMLHSFEISLDELIISGVVARLTLDWLPKRLPLSHSCTVCLLSGENAKHLNSLHSYTVVGYDL